MRNARVAVADDVQLNITPLIDMTFQLLIFFMCVMKFHSLERKVAAFLPSHGPWQRVVPIDPEPKISVTLKRAPQEVETRVKLLDTELGTGETAFAELDRRLLRIRAGMGADEMGGYIDAHADVPHGEVIRCVDAFLKAGVTDVEFKGAPPPR